MTDTAAQSLALALGVSALVTVACRRIKVPALLPLLGVGLALGKSGLGSIDASALGPALKGFITVAIGLLIFEGALHLNKQELSRAPRAVWGLLTVGALLTWAGAAAAAHLLLHMSLPIAILLGATVIVTGPTVVQPILRLVRVSPRLHTALSAEAVLIDPLGVVATIATLEVLRLYLLAGPQASLASEGIWLFAKPLVGGAGVGLVMGFLGLWLFKLIGKSGRPEPRLLNLVAIGVCMTCVGIGEAVTPEAGLAAVTICGVIVARARVIGGTELRAFKELLAIILVGTLFVILTSTFDVPRLGTLTWREGVFVLLLLFVVRPVSVFTSTWYSALTFREKLFAATFAPRGIVALSVAAVATAEIGLLLADPANGSPSAQSAAWIADAQRLDLIMFVVIAGTVLLASTFSPLWAHLLSVRAGEGTAVLLVGGHPMSVEVARRLTNHGISVRLVDSNDARVAAAASAGIDAVSGDATDARWMDDMGSPHGTGWVIAWTGNVDVDQVVARWTHEKIGDGHAAVWSGKPLRDPLTEADIGGGEPLTDWLDRYMVDEVEVAESTEAKSLKRVLGWVREGRFTLNTLKAKPPGQGSIFIGLRETASVNSGNGASSGVPSAAPLIEPDASSEEAGRTA